MGWDGTGQGNGVRLGWDEMVKDTFAWRLLPELSKGAAACPAAAVFPRSTERSRFLTYVNREKA